MGYTAHGTAQCALSLTAPPAPPQPHPQPSLQALPAVDPYEGLNSKVLRGQGHTGRGGAELEIAHLPKRI